MQILKLENIGKGQGQFKEVAYSCVDGSVVPTIQSANFFFFDFSYLYSYVEESTRPHTSKETTRRIQRITLL